MVKQLSIQWCWILLLVVPMVAHTPGSPDIVQNQVPSGYFQSPMNIPLFLAGNFGELRRNHFHAGIDIKTQQREGLDILASAEGYVSRVKVSPYGYGTVVYLTHPNGFTTTYAHLQRLEPKLAAYVKAQQYKKQRYAIELFPGKDQFVYQQGELIAYSGNSGSSGGPHLHFEIRNGAQAPLNPFLFGIDVKDDRRPNVQALAVYPMDEKRHIADGKIYRLESFKNFYQPTSGVIKVNSKQVAFGVQAYDQANGAANKNGVYSIKVAVDGNPIYRFKAEKINFSIQRAMNAHIDYKKHVLEGRRLHKCVVAPNNKLPMYSQLSNRGIYTFKDKEEHSVLIELQDFAGNTSYVKLKVQYDPSATTFPDDPMAAVNRKMYAQRFRHDRTNSYYTDDMQLRIPRGVLFDTLYLEYEKLAAKKLSSISDLHRVHKGYVPVLKRYDLSIKPTEPITRHKDKVLMAVKNAKGRISDVGGVWTDDGFVKARPREFGDFFLTYDTIPPRINPINISNGRNMSGSSYIRFTITDNLSGIDSYQGFVDGQWVLFEYDAKYNRLTHYFDGTIKPGAHQLKMVVKDDRGNEKTYSCNFTR